MPTGLLVIDVQAALCSGHGCVHDAEGVIERCNGLADRARTTGASVLWVQHTDNAGEMFRHGSPGWQLDGRLAVHHADGRVFKTACDAFLRTNLQDQLQERRVDRLVVCGLQTEYCVDSTVRSALARGYEVVVASDAHSTTDNGVLTATQIVTHHNLTIANLDNFGPPVTVQPAALISFVV
jgi:nicotinamidase-related amidase